MRNHNTTRDGFPFEFLTRIAVWQKASSILGYAEAEWRIDAYGNLMKYSDYGDINSNYGWEIDHIFPVSLGGKGMLSNLQPLQWRKNRLKGNSYPYFG
ncbi:HNH endonuclease signature motif containing protein [Legionella tunisiensis]|uniref:HNH endonuclease signature motif containing protein n=1 Tax=Legionella tunisiensis TaxID=1034944 RepID=UPI0002DE4BE5|nr:HNH endonuclease signature motif containing protein [Legionella tunisiensis]